MKNINSVFSKGRKYNRAFTLVELIVVIIIISILWTISFMSIQWYSSRARDSVRKSDIKSISTSIEMFAVKTWFFPVPTDWREVTFSGAEVWTQWTIWDSVINSVNELSKEIVDPVTQTPYTYSRLHWKQKYEIATAFEREVAINIPSLFINETYASWETIANAYLEWNYNWVVTKISTWTLSYVLAIPSIVSSDLNITDVMDYKTDNKFVYHGYQDLPANYENSKFKVDWWTIDYNPSNIVVYESWSFDYLDDVSVQVQLLSDLQEAYSWVLDVDKYDSLTRKIVNIDIDLNNPSSEAEYLACNISKNILGVSGYCTWDSASVWGWNSCDNWTKPSDNGHITYVDNPTGENQAYVKRTLECWFKCNDWYFWDECENSPMVYGDMTETNRNNLNTAFAWARIDDSFEVDWGTTIIQWGNGIMLQNYGLWLSSVPSEIRYLNNLEILDFYGNSFSSIPEEALDLINLKALRLDSNNLSSLPSWLVNLTNLEELILDDNPLLWNLNNYFDKNSASVTQTNITPEWYSMTVAWNGTTIDITIQ